MSRTSLRVLVVDDDAVTRFLMTEFLESLGHRPTAVSGGQACMEKVYDPTFSCDVIMMDMHMPGQTGIEVAMAIRAIDKPCAQRLPIVALTADPEFAATGGPGLFCGIVAKPVGLAGVDAALRPHMVTA